MFPINAYLRRKIIINVILKISPSSSRKNKMLNENLENNPGLLQTSIQNKQGVFQNKVKNVHNCDEDILKTTFLETLYNDSSNESVSLYTERNSKCKTIKQNMELFESEKYLVLADQYNKICMQSKTPTMLSNLQDERFVACEQLFKKHCLKENDIISPRDIMESEMVNCSQTVESTLDRNENICEEMMQSFHSPPQSAIKKSIVEIILEDFCSSPCTSPKCTPTKQRDFSYLERTPRFKLLHKPTRVYSKRKRTTAETELTQENLRDVSNTESLVDNESISSLVSSPLSIQDDIQPIKDNLETVVPHNTSQYLCHNLLNLTNYFTQNSQTVQCETSRLEDNILSNNELFPTKLIEKLSDQVIDLKTQYSTVYDKSKNSSEEFQGFSSRYDDDLCLRNVNNVLDDTIIEPDIMKLSAGSLPNYSLSPVYENQNDDASSSATSTVSKGSLPDHNENEEQKTDYVITSTKHWFENDDDDDDFFATFATQDVVLGSTKTDETKSEVSTKITPCKYVLRNTNNTDNFLGFKTAKGNNVYFSEESRKRIENLLKDFNANDNILQIENDLKEMKSKKLNERMEVSGGAINVAIAGNITEESEPEKNITIMQAGKKNNVSEDNFCSGFKTANGCDVNISAKARKSVEHILKECDFKEDFNEFNGSKRSNVSEYNLYSDFKTANGCDVHISEEARQSVEHILKECDFKENLNELRDLKQKIQKQNKCKYPVAATTTVTPVATTNRINIANSNNNNEDYENEKNQTYLLLYKSIQSKEKEKYFIGNSEILSPGNSDAEQQKQQISPGITLYDNEYNEKNEETKCEDSEQDVSYETKKIITRKNLLSLSKKNKKRITRLSYASKNNNAIEDNNDIDEYTTPLKNVPKKTYLKTKEKATTNAKLSSSSSTPSMQQFFLQAARTSTPFGLLDNREYKKLQRQQDKDEMDTGLMPITWSDNNNESTLISSSHYSSPISSSSLATSKSPSTKTLILRSQQHTVRERLLLLEMYGNAPNLSPIFIQNQQQHKYKMKERPYGLKRPHNKRT